MLSCVREPVSDPHNGSTAGRVAYGTDRLPDRSITGPAYCSCRGASLERAAHTRGHLVGIVRVTPRVHAIDKLRGSQCRTCEQIGALEVERRVWREPPRDPKVRLGPDVAGVALDPALVVYRRPADRARPQTRRGARVGVDLLRRPRRTGDAPYGERWRDVVRAPEGESRGAVPVVPDAAGLVGQQRTVEVINSAAQDPAPARPPIPVHAERLIVADAPGEVVARLVAGRVHAPRLGPERTH